MLKTDITYFLITFVMALSIVNECSSFIAKSIDMHLNTSEASHNNILVLVQTTNRELSATYPEIAFERRQFMNWDHDFLTKIYEESGRNNERFLNKLRNEYIRTLNISKKLKNFNESNGYSNDEGLSTVRNCIFFAIVSF